MIHETASFHGMPNVGECVDIGKNTKIGHNVFIGNFVKIGDNCNIQGNVFIPEGVIIKNNVFVGPCAVFTNTRDFDNIGKHKFDSTIVKDNVIIGANATIVCGITIWENARIAAGSVVTKDVDENQTVKGNPAR